jgi:hypothetical protein
MLARERQQLAEGGARVGIANQGREGPADVPIDDLPVMANEMRRR